MQCPFCHAANPPASSACQVCGGPLRAPQSHAAPLQLQNIPFATAPTLLKRVTFDEKASPLIDVSFWTDEKGPICLVRQAGVVQLWHGTNDEISSISTRRPFRKSSPICCATLALGLVATGHRNGRVRLHALEFDAKRGAWTRRELALDASHIGRVLALVATPTQLYSGGSDGVIWATPLKAKRKSRTLIEGLGAMTTLAVSPDATLLAVGRDDGAVQLWRCAEDETPRLDWTRREHTGPIRSLAFSPNGHMLISRARDGDLCLWAAQTSYQLPLSPPCAHSSVAPAFSADSCLLAIANARNGVDIFDVALGHLLYKLQPLGEKVRKLKFSSDADETSLIVAGTREIALWKIG